MNLAKGAGLLSGIVAASGLPIALMMLPSLLGPVAGTPVCRSSYQAPVYSPDKAYYAAAEIYVCEDDGRDGPLYVLDVNSAKTNNGALLLVVSLKDRVPPTLRWDELRKLRITGLEDLWPRVSKPGWCEIRLESDSRP